MKRIWFATILLLAFASRLPAAEPVSTSGWQMLATPGFTVVSQLNAADTTAWAQKFNQFLFAMRHRIPGDPRRLTPLTVVLFSSRGDFWNLAPVLKDGDPMHGLAAFSRNNAWGSIEASCLLGSEEDSERVLFQGGAAWMRTADRRPMPNALRVGIDEVFSTYSVEGAKATIGQPPRGWTGRLIRALNSPMNSDGRFLTVTELLSVKDISTVEDRHILYLFFDESWAFAHFLLFSKEMAETHAMDRLIEAFGHDEVPLTALRTALGPMADNIDSRFTTYLRGGDFFQATVPVDAESALGSTTAQPAAPATVAAALAQLEAGAHHPELAESYAAEAVQLAPDAATSYDALTLADSVALKFDDAKAACESATRLHSRNGWTWYLHAQDRRKAGEALSPEQARDVVNDLEKAIKYQPGLELAFTQIATALATANHVTEDDGKFLMFGRILYPEDGWIQVGHAQWAYRTDQPKLALQIIDDVLRSPDKLKPDELKQAQAMKLEWAKYMPN
jgi:hypothetical protein